MEKYDLINPFLEQSDDRSEWSGSIGGKPASG